MVSFILVHKMNSSYVQKLFWFNHIKYVTPVKKNISQKWMCNQSGRVVSTIKEKCLFTFTLDIVYIGVVHSRS